MRGLADSGKESAFHPRCGGKRRCILERGERRRPQRAVGGPSRLNGVCAGVHPQGGMHGGGRPRAGPPHPRPAPLTELHQRVEEAGDRHQEVGEKHVLQLQLHGRAAAWAGGVRGGLGGPRPPPASLQTPPLQRPRPVSRLPHAPLHRLARGGNRGARQGPLPVSLHPSPRVNFRSLCLVLGTTGVGDVTSGVASSRGGQ